MNPCHPITGESRVLYQNSCPRASQLVLFPPGYKPPCACAVLNTLARAHGMTRLARETGLGRESLYKALGPSGNPELATLEKVARALGKRLVVVDDNEQ